MNRIRKEISSGDRGDKERKQVGKGVSGLEGDAEPASQH